MWNLPNSLTMARIVMVPLLVVVLLTEFPDREYWGLAIFLVAAVTDLMDGMIARRTNRITRTGALLDPIADKLLMSAAFISLVGLDLAPAWMVTIIVGREFAVTALRVVALERRVAIAANAWGKAKTACPGDCGLDPDSGPRAGPVDRARAHRAVGGPGSHGAVDADLLLAEPGRDPGTLDVSRGLLPRRLPLALVRTGRRWPRTVLVLAAVAWVLAGIAARRVGVETDVLSLVPEHNRVVSDFKTTVNRFGSVDMLLAVVRLDRADDPESAVAFADHLAEALRGWELIAGSSTASRTPPRPCCRCSTGRRSFSKRTS